DIARRDALIRRKITDIEYEFPPWVSESFKDLISSIFRRAEDRIGMIKIKDHPWVNPERKRLQERKMVLNGKHFASCPSHLRHLVDDEEKEISEIRAQWFASRRRRDGVESTEEVYLLPRTASTPTNLSSLSSSPQLWD